MVYILPGHATGPRIGFQEFLDMLIPNLASVLRYEALIVSVSVRHAKVRLRHAKVRLSKGEIELNFTFAHPPPNNYLAII